MTNEPMLRAHDIHKRFGHVEVLRGVSLSATYRKSLWTTLAWLYNLLHKWLARQGAPGPVAAPAPSALKTAAASGADAAAATKAREDYAKMQYYEMFRDGKNVYTEHFQTEANETDPNLAPGTTKIK